MCTVAPHVACLMDHIEGEELLAEITLVEFFAEDDFVGVL